MKILYIASNPDGAATLQVDREINLLQERLDEAATVEPIDLRFYSYLQIDQLPGVIARVAPDIIHFAAHGKDDGIALAQPGGGYVQLDGTQLADLLRAIAVRPKLVVINACASAEMAGKVARSADFVIGTDALISNVGARNMAGTLYQRLANGASIEQAFEAARTMLDVIDGGQVGAHLCSVGDHMDAKRLRLTEPLRILACFPRVEKWLRYGLTEPKSKFDPEMPVVEFGVAGAPASVRQIVFFTDDESVQPTGKRTMEEMRSWIIETQPVRGEIWIDPSYEYYVDLHWYASVTTADHQILSASSGMCDALERYYFEELWQGALPAAIEKVVRAAITELRRNDGSRRSRGSPVKMSIAPAKKTGVDD